MLSEKCLNSVNGGTPVIDLVGGIATLGARIGNWVASFGVGRYSATDSSGQHGTMNQFRAWLSPAFFGTNHFGARQQDIRVLNSNNMQDLHGARLVLGAVASFPQALQESLGREFGAKHETIIGLAIPKNAGGAQISVPIINTTGQTLTDGMMISVSAEDTKHVQIIGQGMRYGVEAYGGIEFNGVKVDDRDGVPAPNFCMQQLRPDGTFKFPWEP